MKTLISICLLIFFGIISYAQTTNSKYDPELAESLGADQYGMKSYVLVILKTGETQMDDKDKVNELFQGHMANISKLVDEGKLIVAGPLGKNDQSYRGIFILDVKTIEEAKVLVDTDPAVISGLLAADYFPWYGSAALPVYFETAEKITKENH